MEGVFKHFAKNTSWMSSRWTVIEWSFLFTLFMVFGRWFLSELAVARSSFSSHTCFLFILISEFRIEGWVCFVLLNVCCHNLVQNISFASLSNSHSARHYLSPLSSTLFPTLWFHSSSLLRHPVLLSSPCLLLPPHFSRYVSAFPSSLLILVPQSSPLLCVPHQHGRARGREYSSQRQIDISSERETLLLQSLMSQNENPRAKAKTGKRKKRKQQEKQGCWCSKQEEKDRNRIKLEEATTVCVLDSVLQRIFAA